jgi:multicomponent Na+:H+ antiporter subunit E
MKEHARRFFALGIWAYVVWLLLTWTATAEQLVFGGLLASAVALALMAFGPVATPWGLFAPRRFWAVLRLLVAAAGRIVRANVSLAARIWNLHRPLHSGMIILPTAVHTDGELAATGLITSLIVDNQIVDLDRSAAELQYHAVAVPEGTPRQQADAVNAPTERLVGRVGRGRKGT